MALFVSIISSAVTWDRISRILSSSEFSEYSLYVASREAKYSPIFFGSQELRDVAWNECIDTIVDSLYINTLLNSDRLFSPYLTAPPSFRLSSWLKPRELRKAEISCFYKHLSAMNLFVRSQSDYGLFLEDDVALRGSPLLNISGLISNLSPSYVDISDTAGMPIPSSISCIQQKANIIFHPVLNCKISVIPWKSSRTSAAYLISREFAYELIYGPNKYILPYDLYLAYILHKTGTNPYWVDGAGFIHGSSYGDVLSSTK